MKKTEYKGINPSFKKALSTTVYVVVCALAAICLLLSVFLVSVAMGMTEENTVGLFGYKVYTCNEDIEKTDIKKGSLVIIKNTDDDEFYTPDYLAKNAVVISQLGAVLKGYSTYIAIILMLPAALVFALVLMREMSKKIIVSGQKSLEKELEFTQIEEFEEIEEIKK